MIALYFLSPDVGMCLSPRFYLCRDGVESMLADEALRPRTTRLFPGTRVRVYRLPRVDPWLY